MDKSQSELFLEILRRLDKEGVLSKIILIGSWCLPIYRHYYSGESNLTTLRTRDIDFLVSRKVKIKEKVDLPKLLEDLGFIEDYKFPQGHVRLVHPELIMELLVEERGRGSEEPYPLPFLSMNAQKVRLLGMLEENTVTVDYNGVEIRLPHPVNYGFHKLIISSRRRDEDKKQKDIDTGLSVLNMCVENDEGNILVEVFKHIPKKQKKSISNIINIKKEYGLLKMLGK